MLPSDPGLAPPADPGLAPPADPGLAPPADPVGVPGAWRPWADVLAALPLLAGLSPDLRALVERSFVPVALEFGDTVFRRGDAADGYYVVADGEARVLIESDDGSEVTLNKLERGAAFGERGLLEGGTRTSTVRASSALVVLRLDQGVFNALIELDPRLGERLDAQRFIHRVSDLLRLHPVFAAMDGDTRFRLAAAFKERSVPDGAVVVRQGDEPDAVHIVAEGRFGVWSRGDDGVERRLRTLHAGEVFGEAAVATGARRTASVRAEGDALVLWLPGDEFTGVLRTHPHVASRVREQVALYELRDRGLAASPAQAAFPDAFDTADPGLSVTDDDGQQDAPAVPARRRRRFPFVRQLDEMDCGAACVAMVCRSFGHDVSLSTIRHAVGTGLAGTTLRGLKRGGEEVGLAVRAVKSSADRLEALPLPAIAHWEGNHWVVLHRVDREHVRVADPARGLRRLPRVEFEAAWSGYAAVTAPTERLAEAPRGGLDLRWLWPFVRPHRTKLAGAVLLAIVAAGLEMLLPVFSKIVVDRAIPGRNPGLVHICVLAMLGVLGIAVLALLLQRFVLARIAVRVDGESLDFVTERLLRLPMRYFETRRTGDLERRLSGMRQVRQVLVQSGVAAVSAAAQLAVALTVMFAYSWRMALLFFACAPLYGALMSYSKRRLRPVFDALEEGFGRYQSRQIDAIKGIETVKAMGAEPVLRRRMLAEFTSLQEKLYRSDVAMMAYDGLTQVVTFMVFALFLWIGALQVLAHRLTLGELVSFNALVLLAAAPIAVLLGLWDKLQVVAVLLGRLQDVLDSEPEQGASQTPLAAVESLGGHVRLQGVTFAYPTSPDHPVLTDISLDVQPGMTVALVGRSGSGKSTLAKCLAGLVLPTAGAIRYDGVPLHELSLRELRQQIGFVLQEPYLFDASIEANIALGDARPDPSRVRWAAEVANAAEFIERLPLRYATHVGDSGLRLSGGQAQRLAIARALYRQPPVLVFDEATSALDAEAERAVKESMDRLLQGRTAFVVAHRLSTIRDADVICVLERGRLVESGAHEELMARQGLYAYLVSQQIEG